MKQQTQLDHEQRIAAAIGAIIEKLDEPIDLRALADTVCLSRFHFHRVFQALTGETVGDMVRRLRLERAAHCLVTGRTPITELAFAAGYATHEAFIRAFRAAFGCTPSAMRRHLQYDGRLPTPNGVHYGQRLEIRFLKTQGATAMQVEIREIAPRKAVCMSHRGPYYMIGQTFERFGAWLNENNLETQGRLALFYDDPEATPVNELRSDAGAFVADGYTTNDPNVHVVDVAGGTYAVATYIGPYDGLSNAWNEFGGKWLPGSGYSFAQAASFEVYLNGCHETDPSQLRTELYIPVVAA
jgi:AraC family transcriptional regulator